MQRLLGFLGLAAVASGAACVFAACGTNRGDFGAEPASNPFGREDAGAPTECQESVRCSPDLKKVLRRRCDGTEEVITECGPDLGCGDGACVDPCKSAELSKGSIGCSFATLAPDSTTGGVAGSCFAATIANTWDRPVTIRAELGADPIDVGPSTYFVETNGDYTHVDGALAPGKVAIVFLAGTSVGTGYHIECPRAPALREDPIAHKTTRTRAFRLSTDAPVSAYSIWPYGGARSYVPTATLLLPVSSWGTNYIAVSGWTTRGNPFLQIVAAEDDTEVRMRPNVDIGDGTGLLGVAQGQTQTWSLARGEVLQITQPLDASGSPIEASKPVAFFGGVDCANVPQGVPACDSMQQQIPPVSQWGNEYALVPYRPRKGVSRETVPWRFVGAANGTKLTYDPAPPGLAPETLESGQVVTFMTPDLVTVRSQDKEHPFYVAQFMTGADTILGSGSGDPDFVNVVPSGQFLDRYIFFADYTYGTTTLTLVRHKTVTGFHPVAFECGAIADWKPLGNAGDYEYAWILAEGTCRYGRQEAHSDGPFAVYVWGTDRYASYGYPGGMGSRPLNDVKGPSVN